ncbi:MAG: hypothetical protein HY707_07875 [Ignavibacteriae bacterium]|nr:hypothetical protein [Ignavibacteriota bacterium]
MARYLFTITLIALAVLSRLIPHPPNFAPITALALFSGVYLDKKYTFIVPLVAMLISDYFLGFYTGMAWVYASFIAIGFIGLWLRNHRGIGQTIGATLVGSILFFVVTNFGVWVSSKVAYPHTVDGLIACYVAAIPFFRNTLLGDFFYVAALFGAYELGKRYIPALKIQPTGTEV